MPNLARLKDRVLRIVIHQGGQGKQSKNQNPGDKLNSMLEEVDKITKAIFMTGLPKPEASPPRETERRKLQLENEKLLIGKTLEQLGRAEDEKDKKIEQ